MPEIGRQTLDYLKMRGDIDLGANKLKTTNLLIWEGYSSEVWITGHDGATLKNLKVSGVYLSHIEQRVVSTSYLKTRDGASYAWEFQSHNGSAYVTNLKLVGGKVYINQGVLDSDLDVNEYRLKDVGWMNFIGTIGIGRANLLPDSYGTSSDLGIFSANSMGSGITRLLVKGGADIVDIMINKAYLKPDMSGGAGIGIEYYVDDYGGGFANFTPPSGFEGRIIVAIDTNATTPGKRLYVYANGAWNYVDLS